MVIFIITVMWSVYIGMGLLSRRERRSMNSIATFNRHLAVLARTAPGHLPETTSGRPGPLGYHTRRPAAMSLAEVRLRRRRVLTILAAAASVTAALAFVGGGALLALHLVTDALLISYVVLLARGQQQAVEHRSKVVYLPPRQVVAVPAEPAAHLQRSAN
jgi:hypothetical protein